MKRRAVLCGSAAAATLGAVGGLAVLAPSRAGADAAAASALAVIAAEVADGGFLLLIRHATTVPGAGDPPGFDIDRCETQRNLSDAGRAEARRLGEAMRAASVRVDEVRSSGWCRCRDTAALAFGRYAVWAPVNSFFGSGDRDGAQTRQVVALGEAVLAERLNIVLVTHQVNVSALTGWYPAQGELVVARYAAGRIVPRLRARVG